ncbi:MAG: sigma-70 family RNA polymerase sigma factor [Phycisphaerales bacterium]|nr:MAG: sigma-70 family RNA polymerase sigma factor [Phycisphaerales bacterium]
MTQDIEVIRRVLQGDAESFRFLVERYERPIVRMIKNVTGDMEGCEDIAQDVFFTAYRKLSSFDPACSNFSTWLFTIARNRSINASKKKRPRSMVKLPESTNRDNPGDEIAKEEFFERLDMALQALPSAQRRAFVLAEFEKLPYAEIALIEGARTGTIKSRISRAKRKLRSVLEDFAGGVA